MSDPERLDLLIRGAHLCTCAGPPGAPAAERLDRIPDGAVGVRGGRIVYVGSSLEAPGDAAEIVDAEGRALSPGLVDPHTHLVFAGSRVDEFARRMAGEDYRAIAAAGGGIVATVRATRAASDEELYAGAAARALAMRARGVTAVEIKSGYGLSLEHESRLLRVARRLDAEGLLRVRTSFLGAHAIPPERRGERARYLDELVQQMLPAIVEEGLADAIDVYCDEGAFTLEETRRLLEAGREAGLGLRAHLGQFADLGGPELLAELGALSADHLEEVSDAGLAAMARADVIAVLLPGAFCTLRQRPPSVSRMRAAGVRMAVGTDCNPGTSPSTDLPLMASLAVRIAHLTLEEALLAVTAEAADAAGFAGGARLVPGAPADLTLWGSRDPRALAYSLGGARAARVWIGGLLAHLGGPADQEFW